MNLSFFDETFKTYMVDFIKETMEAYSEDADDAVYDLINDLENLEDKFKGEDFEVRSGASKLVFLEDSKVYKVYFDEECLCETEPTVYKRAKAKGLEDYFAKTGELHEESFCIDDFVVKYWYYEQEKVNQDDPSNRFKSDNFDAWRNSPKAFRNLKTPDCVDNYESFVNCCALSGRSDVQKLFSFLSKLGISDFHTGNFFMKRGCPVLIDFSGYCEG